MGSLQIPDAIDPAAGRVKLQSAARNISAYSAPTPVDIPEIPQTNSFMQLSSALSKIHPALQQVVGHYTQIEQAKDLSAGEVAAHKAASDKTVKNINDAVKAGHLPAGASPTTIQAWQSTFLKLKTEQLAIHKREEYYGNNELRNNPDPHAFGTWHAKEMQAGMKSLLENEDGSPRYTPIEIDKSQAYETMDHSFKALNTEHIAHRTSENERLAVESANNLGSTRLDADLGVGPTLKAKESRDLPAIAQRFTDAYLNKETGVFNFGSVAKKHAKDGMILNLQTKAISEKDASILEIAEHIDTPAGKLATLPEFKKAAQETKEKIAVIKWQDKIHAEESMKMDVMGTVEERKQHWTNVAAHTKHDAAAQRYVDVASDEIIALEGNTTLKGKQKQAELWADFRAKHPTEAQALSLRVLHAREAGENAVNKKKFPLAEMDVANAILEFPGTTKARKIIDQALDDDRYGQSEWLRRRAESDRLGQEKQQYKKILDDDFYKNLELAAGHAVMKDPAHPLGTESYYAGLAKHEFRKRAVAFIKANPDATAEDVADFMEPKLKDITTKYNESAREIIAEDERMAPGRKAVIDNAMHYSQPEVQAQQAEQVRKATAAEAALKAADKQKKKPGATAPK
jgi:hypothetical protein